MAHEETLQRTEQIESKILILSHFLRERVKKLISITCGFFGAFLTLQVQCF